MVDILDEQINRGFDPMFVSDDAVERVAKIGVGNALKAIDLMG